jgi:hypothetical protein
VLVAQWESYGSLWRMSTKPVVGRTNLLTIETCVVLFCVDKGGVGIRELHPHLPSWGMNLKGNGWHLILKKKFVVMAKSWRPRLRFPHYPRNNQKHQQRPAPWFIEVLKTQVVYCVNMTISYDNVCPMPCVIYVTASLRFYSLGSIFHLARCFLMIDNVYTSCMSYVDGGNA